MLKIFLLTRNERALIEDWIRYHGYLFGLPNLHLLDGSDDDSILNMYAYYEELGLNIHPTISGLNHLAVELTDLMHAYKGSDNFLIKLDTDEFLAYTIPSVIGRPRSVGGRIRRRMLHSRSGGFRNRLLDKNFSARTIRTENFDQFFAELPVSGHKYKASLTTWSIPTSDSPADICADITSFTNLQYTEMKSFFHSSSFKSVDLGSHRGLATKSDGHWETGLTSIHYHSVSVEDSLSRAKQALVSHGYIDTFDSPSTQLKKLEKRLKRADMDSSHKAELYIQQLRSLNNSGIAFDPSLLNFYNPFYRPYWKSMVRDQVKQVLANVDTSNCFGPRQFPTHKLKPESKSMGINEE